MSFSDLLNGSGTSAGSGGAATAAADDGSADVLADDASGEDAPPGGNGLPLVLPLSLMPPLAPPPVQATASVATDAEGSAAGADGASTSIGISLTAAGVSSSTFAPDTDALPEDILQTLNGTGATQPAVSTAAQTASTEQPAAAANKPSPQPILSAQDAKVASKPDTAAPSAQSATTSGDEAATALAAGFAADSGVDGEPAGDRRSGTADDFDISRRLSSLPVETGAPKSRGLYNGIQQAVQTNASDTAGQLDTSTGVRASDTLSADAAQKLLREFKFERTAEGATSTSSATPTHANGLQPIAATTIADDVPVTQLQTPVQNSQQWADGVGDRVIWMTANNHQNAQIRLNPAHLGPIDVQVSVTGDQTNISFSAHHATTRDALESALPRLRDMLGANGMGNVNVNINHQSAGDRLAQGAPQEPWQQHSGAASDETSAISSASFPATPRGGTRSLIDAYA